MVSGVKFQNLLTKLLRRLADRAGASPTKARRLLNMYPPLFGSGIYITDIAPDWSRGRLELRLNPLIANMHGAAFGGSLFSMTDVLFGTLVMQRLGVEEYEAWTRTGSFEFIRPGRRGTYLEVEVTDELIDQIKAEVDPGYSTVVSYTSVVRSKDGGVVGIGQQDLYVRRRGGEKPKPNPAQLEGVRGQNLIAAARTLARLGLREPERREHLVENERVARRCIRPEAQAVAWLVDVLPLGFTSLAEYKAAGLPAEVIEALTEENPGAVAKSLLAEVAEAKESLKKY